ncbi:excalibur calcium-binding domain-containing protein [Pseudaminobacter arsenicus]|uniref:Excalibur calcium-binding domain-containing protein n=1 Tax=Borborobacter arsenicus TaxID=1851146 RepID=A0A432UZJ4_9HYPH|nr:excalibur calcium-binding domain-containing protein [Pseudaminobacter arsenicus]
MGGELHSFPRQPPDRETHLRKINRRFAGVSRRVDRRRERRWYLRNWKLIAAVLAFAGICGWSIAETDVRSVSGGVRHVLAAPNCSMTRLVGLAPALRGQPGYWRSNDADHDGIACEPWPR